MLYVDLTAAGEPGEKGEVWDAGEVGVVRVVKVQVGLVGVCGEAIEGGSVDEGGCVGVDNGLVLRHPSRPAGEEEGAEGLLAAGAGEWVGGKGGG